MLGTLTLAAGSAVAGWLLQHAYQSLRYSFYEREDAAMLEDGADAAERRDWLAAIGAQIAIQAVAPSTIAALAASGDIDADLLADGESGAYARRYNPTLAGDAYWVPAYLAAAFAGAAYSPAAAVAAVSSLAIAASDIRFRIVPIPHLAVLVSSSVAAFCPSLAGAAPPPPAWRSPGRSAPPCAEPAANGATATRSCSAPCWGRRRRRR